MKIKFPQYIGQRYYFIHYKYIIDLFSYANAEIVIVDIPEISQTSFECEINNKKIIFDFSDGGLWDKDAPHGYSVFKFHYKDKDKQYKNIYPFPPVSFYNWDEYRRLEKMIKYQPGETIQYIQREYGNAIQSRKEMKKILIENFGDKVDIKHVSQYEYWEKSAKCLLSVHVGGYQKEMLDRGQLQLMAFGIPTMSYELPEYLINYEKISKSAYVQISDIDSVKGMIEICQENKKDLIYVGMEAKKLFEENCTPNNVKSFVERVI